MSAEMSESFDKAIGLDNDKKKNEDKPEGEPKLSKNAQKKLAKGVVKKDKPNPAPQPKGEKKEKKPKKEPEVVLVDMTPAGEKKLLDGEFPASYQPSYVESAWQQWWEASGFYTPNVEKAQNLKDDDKFIMVIPPPNVTGSLHLGHALTTTIEDTLVRWNRMRGKVTVWVPGTDHAGIATQSVVERWLKREENLTRHDLGREEFTARVWEWKQKYGSRITTQQRMMAASVDWSREAFTMDDNLSRAVKEAFVKFHEDGLVYRDTRLINWSCSLQSAISDIEVDYIDVEGRTFLPVPNHTKDKYEFGTMTSFAYRVIDGATPDEEIVIATTRLETMLGDTAVAVHPEDPRYKHLHGKFVQHPFVDRRIPIITDAELVDMNFGSGAVKITPAHDPNDNACGKRHNLDSIIMMTGDGRISPNCGEFSGMMRYDARIAMEAALKEKGLFRGKEDNKMRLGLCSRSKDIIEPMLTPQWYVNCNSMAARAVEAVRGGSLKLVPEFHEATWYRWLENIRDWCVSRQLWWGHRIPAYFARIVGEAELNKDEPANNNRWFVARSEEEASAAAAKELGVAVDQIILQQDEDVLDTWFSSGLFPFSVFGWPNPTADMKAFYPTSLLETGHDILFFWVARMVMMGLHLTDQLPFTTVYLHAMVRDKYGRKMSKSLGNVIDPQEVISGCTLEALYEKIESGNLPPKEVEKAKAGQKMDFPEGIPECGTDALRFGLLAYTIQGRDVNLDIKRVVGYRQFCNKLWNAVRFALTYIPADFRPSPTMHLELSAVNGAAPRDAFILSKLNGLIVSCTKALEEYSFGAVANNLHAFFLYDFCDVYLELIKPVIGSAASTAESGDEQISEEAKKIARGTLYTCLEQFLRLAHPLMPYVTEELWQRLPSREALTSVASIMIAPYPTPQAQWTNAEAEEQMSVVSEAIHGARSLRADYRLANHIKATFYFRSDNAAVQQALVMQADDFCTLAKAGSLHFLATNDAAPKSCAVKVLSEQLTLLVDLTGLLNIDEEIARLTKDKERLIPQVAQYEKKISAPNYEEKVPENVRALNLEKLASYRTELGVVEAAIRSFEGMR